MTDGIENGHPTNAGYRVGPFRFPDSDSVHRRAKKWLEQNDPVQLETLTVDGDWLQTTNNIFAWGENDGHGNGAARIQVLDPGTCQRLKDQDVKVIVTNVEYEIPEYRHADSGPPIRYDDPATSNRDRRRVEILVDLKPRIEEELAECASAPDLLFSVTEESEMAEAFEKIFGDLYGEQVVFLSE